MTASEHLQSPVTMMERLKTWLSIKKGDPGLAEMPFMMFIYLTIPGT